MRHDHDPHDSAPPQRDAPKLGRDWRLLWSASTISVLGDGAFTAALPLLAAGLTRDPRLISGLTIAGTLPWLLFSLYSGAVADRSEGRRLLIRAQAAQLIAVTLVGVLAGQALGGIWSLYALAFGLGTAAVVAKSASETLLPSLVSPDLLVTANGRLYTSQSVSQQFLGPAVGSALFLAAPFLPFWIDAASFALSMLLIARLPAARVEKSARDTRRKVRADIKSSYLARLGQRSWPSSEVGCLRVSVEPPRAVLVRCMNALTDRSMLSFRSKPRSANRSGPLNTCQSGMPTRMTAVWRRPARLTEALNRSSKRTSAGTAAPMTAATRSISA